MILKMKTFFFQSRESSVSSSPKSGSVNLSNASTPSGTPGKSHKHQVYPNLTS